MVQHLFYYNLRINCPLSLFALSWLCPTQVSAGCTWSAIMLFLLNSQNPGSLLTSTRLFQLPHSVQSHSWLQCFILSTVREIPFSVSLLFLLHHAFIPPDLKPTKLLESPTMRLKHKCCCIHIAGRSVTAHVLQIKPSWLTFQNLGWLHASTL